MNSPWAKEASQACSFNRCLNLLLGYPKSLNHSLKSIDNSATFQYDFATATTTSLYPHHQFTSHESLPNLQEAFHSFIRAYPQYLQTVEADQIRTQDYNHLSLLNLVCLDYIGHGLFSYTQQQGPDTGADDVASTSSAPPPSPHPSPSEQPFFEISFKSVTLNSQIVHYGQESDFESIFRRRIMQFFNISEDDYSMVFTANQTLAFTLLAESYPFATNPNLLTVYDHENEAVEAIIESSRRRGAQTMSAEFKWPKLKLQDRKLRQIVTGKKKKSNRGLFVFPLQSRVTGARYSYQWMNMAREHGWHVLLDASAIGSKDMDTLGLSLFRPDYLICTCYKVFGENPSGFACLFVKKSHASMLKDLTTASSRGIVSLVPATKPSQLSTLPATTTANTEHPSKQKLQKDDHSAQSSTSEAFQQRVNGPSTYQESEQIREQKQLPPAEIEELENWVQSTRSKDTESRINTTRDKFNGLDHADSLGLIIINNRARYLINWLVNALLVFKHPNSGDGHQLIKIYGPRIRFDRAPALAFNIFDWKGEKVDPNLVQKLADRHHISLVHGFIKNIWFPDKYEEDKEKALEQRSNRRGGDNCGISVITANLGFLTNFEDVYRVWVFVSRFLDADFVEKERWRYAALNRKTLEV